MKHLNLPLAFVAGLFVACSAQTNPPLSMTDQLRKDIRILANDSLQGRGSGTAGERMATDYLAKSFQEIGLQPKGDSETFSQSFTYPTGMHGMGPAQTAYNVIGFLDNDAGQTIVIGAHYDHLGLGMIGGSLDPDPQNKIHNGADDNASGTAGVLALARFYKNNNVKEKYNFLFICFSGEELGLLGSKHFTENPSVNLSQVNYMINMDMIGRLDAERSLEIGGTGTSPAWEPLINKVATNFKVTTDSSGVGPSDHTSFYLKEIPVLHFFTGGHMDYHKPSDDWDKINYEGEADVLVLITKIINALDSEAKLAFLPTKNNSMNTSASFNVTLGILPDYTSNDGLRVDAVTPNRPADKGGIQPGDIIIRMGDRPVQDIQAYMEALGVFEKGQTVEVEIVRGNERQTLSVTF